METKFKVKEDYLSFSGARGAIVDLLIDYGLVFPQEMPVSVAKGGYGFNERLNYKSGVTVYTFARTTPQTRAYVQLSGQMLELVRKDGNSVRSMMSAARAAQIKTTRADISCDLFNSGYTAIELSQPSAVNKEGKPLSRQAVMSLDGTGGQTIYIGSRSSERMARVYNKAAEMGMSDDVDWVRFELEFKGDRAAWCVANWLDGSEAGLTDEQLFVQMSEGMLEHHIKDSIADSVSVVYDYEHESKKDTSTHRWLYGQVRIAIKNYARKNGTAQVTMWLGEVLNDLHEEFGLSSFLPQGGIVGSPDDLLPPIPF